MPISGARISPSCTDSMIAFADASRLSPRTIRVNRPYRSVMWCGCQGVVPRRSAMTGTASSAAMSTRIAQGWMPPGSSSDASHSACTARMPPA